MAHSLTLGSVVLTGKDDPDPDHGFEFDVLAEGVSFGVAKGVKEIIQSLLGDGDLVRINRYGNREVTFSVEITGPDLASVAQGEAALRREVGRPNLLTWQPPGDNTPASVFKVVVSEMTQTFDDLDELLSQRVFVVMLECAPGVRSAGVTTVGAVPPPTTTSTISVDTCDSATGWTAAVDRVAAPVSTTWESGAVSVVELTNPAPQLLQLTRTGSVNFSATRYLVIEAGYNAGVPPVPVKAYCDGTEVNQVSQTTIAPGWFRRVYDTRGVTATTLMFAAYSTTDYADLKIRQVSRSSLPPGSSGRETTRIIEIDGTERTPASLHAYTSSGFLGATILHTTPFDGTGYSPDMRRWRASGNTTSTNVDARRITGIWEPMKPNPVISRTPAHSLPRGDYLLVAAIKSDTAVSDLEPLPIDWAAKSVTSGQIAGQVGGRGWGVFPVAHQLTIVPIASLPAPVVRSGALDLEIHLLNPTATVDLQVEQWWLFKDDEDSALSIVNTAEGNLWLESPDVDSSVPTYWVGPERSLAYHPAAGLIAPGSHRFKPGQVLVTSVSDSNDYLECALSYTMTWHSNAPK